MGSRVKDIESKFFTPRDYQVALNNCIWVILNLFTLQLELLNRAVDHNTIVALGTGTGKTFIAALLIKEYAFRLLENGEKAIFVVDKGFRFSFCLLSSLNILQWHLSISRPHTLNAIAA